MSNGGDQRCPSCFRPAADAPCPHCGFEGAGERNPLILPLGFELDDRYRIGHVLGKPGGFGITYLAFDERLQMRVAVKEYMPREIAARGSDGASVRLYSADEDDAFEYGLDRFLGEARALTQFDHANIVGVQDFFEANGTAYLAMDYYEGKTLKQYLAEQPNGWMNPKAATEIMLRVLDGLREVHAEGYLHRDVKPDNIYLTAEGRPILIDFGAARLALGERSRSLSVVMTEGYAPYEQYSREGNQGPHTDVYGCGATLYRMVTGQKPPPATDRVIEDRLEAPSTMNPAVPEGLSRAITDALAMGDEMRLGTAKDFQERLQARPRTEASSPEQPPAGGQETGDRVSRQRGSPQDASTSEPVEASEPTGGPGGDGGAGSAPSFGTEGDRARGSRQGVKDDSEGIGINPYAVVGVLAVLLGGVGVALYSGGGTGAESQVRALLEQARSTLNRASPSAEDLQEATAAARDAKELRPGSGEAEKLLGRIASRAAELGQQAEASLRYQQAIRYYEQSVELRKDSTVRKKLKSARKIRAGRVPVRTLRGHEDGVASVAFSPDGSLVATGSRDNTAKLWYVPQGI